MLSPFCSCAMCVQCVWPLTSGLPGRCLPAEVRWEGSTNVGYSAKEVWGGRPTPSRIQPSSSSSWLTCSRARSIERFR